MIVYFIISVIWAIGAGWLVVRAVDRDVNEGRFFLGAICYILLLVVAIGSTIGIRNRIEVDRYVAVNQDVKAWIRERTRSIGNLTKNGVDALLENEIAKLSHLLREKDDPEDVAILANAKALLERERKELKRIRDREESGGDKKKDDPGEFIS